MVAPKQLTVDEFEEMALADPDHFWEMVWEEVLPGIRVAVSDLFA